MDSKDNERSTPFARGRAAGQWTEQSIEECGFASVQKFLEQREKSYQEELDCLPSLHVSNPALAVQHAEYMEGYRAGTRESLRGGNQ